MEFLKELLTGFAQLYACMHIITVTSGIRWLIKTWIPTCKWSEGRGVLTRG